MKRTIYSREPDILGNFDIDCEEMMFVQDMPVAMPREDVRLPHNLECFRPLINAVMRSGADFYSYIYLSAKRMFVSPDSNYNRSGWHIDGFGTEDKNYLWSDSNPTEFCVNQEFVLSDDHTQSMREMEAQAGVGNIKTYPNGSLIGVDNTIVHRVAKVIHPGLRTFAKVSVSKNKYNLLGNAHNYLFDYDWEMVERNLERNDTSVKKGHQ
jgi:hypothetical protein